MAKPLVTGDYQIPNKIRSGVSKPLIIFLSVMIVVCSGIAVMVSLLPSELHMRIIGWALCGFFGIVALVILIDHLFDYVYVEKDSITKVLVFTKKSAKIREITKIRHIEGYYEIFINRKKFTTLSDRDPATTKMFFQFEKMGVDIGNIEKGTK